MAVSEAGPSYDLLTSESELTSLVARMLAEGRPFGFDIETGYEGESREKAGLHPEENFICGISLTNSVSWARYIPLRHDQGVNMDPGFAWRALKPLLFSGLGVAHGGKFELRCIARVLLELGLVPDLAAGYFTLFSDSMLEAHAEGTHKTVALKPLTFETFRHKMTELLELFPSGLTQKEEHSIRFNVLDQHDPKVHQYACEDSVYALANHLRRYPRVRGTLIYKTEMLILPIVCEMEDNGLRYDWTFMRDGLQRGEAFRDKLSAQISAELSGMLGEPVKLNLGSPKQVADILYTRLGMPVGIRTKKTEKGGGGNPSTGKLALKRLSGQYPVVQEIVNWKQISRLCGTYLKKYELDYSYAPDGLTHPNHMQHGVPAGRFAVGGPPYQQSPKKYHYELKTGETFDFSFRDSIVVPPGYYGLGYDYSQMEVRVLAGEAGEAQLVEAFAQGVDIHRKTASLMLGVPAEAITDAQRDLGKTLGLALGYSMGVKGLADRLSITREEAQALFDQYFAAYPAIKAYVDHVVSQAMRNGYITTKFGRRVPIWEFESADRYIRSEGERLAGNAPIQGGAADYMKIAMVRADRALRKTGLHGRGIKLVMNIHDALEWYVPNDLDAAGIIHALTDPGVIDDHPAILFPVGGWPDMAAEWHVWRKWGSAKKIEVHGDEIVVKGDRVDEGLNEDDELEGPSLPKVDLEALRRERHEAVAAESPVEPGPAGPHSGPGYRPVLRPAAAGPPRTVIIEIAGRPDGEAFRRLCLFADSAPGPHTVVLRVPEGDITFGPPCGITPADEPDISLLLGGARVLYAPSSVDFGALSSGVDV